jgi:Predicted acyltransferases
MQKIKGLDGLRGISVLLVIFSHAMIFDRLGWRDPIFRKIVSAENGVSVFFVLSGFLITLLLLREQKQTGSINVLNFYARRTLRIFPLYFLAITLVLVLDLLSVISLRSCTYQYAYTYLFNFVPKQCSFSAFSHFWSLAVEEHFYIVWPFVFLLGPRIAIGLLLAFLAAVQIWDTSLFSAYASTHSINRWTFPAAAPIVYGCLAAYIAASPAVSGWMGKATVSRAVLVAAILGVVGYVAGMPRIYFLAGVALLILFMYFNQRSLLVRSLEFRPLAYIGLISYGLYVWQGIFTGNGPYRQFPAFPPPIDYGLLLTFIAAPLSYAFFEKPIMRLKRRFQGAREVARPASRNGMEAASVLRDS